MTPKTHTVVREARVLVTIPGVTEEDTDETLELMWGSLTDAIVNQMRAPWTRVRLEFIEWETEPEKEARCEGRVNPSVIS